MTLTATDDGELNVNCSTPARRTTIPDNPLTRRSSQSIQQMLDIVRDHLDMEVAFVGEFVDGQRVFRYVSARGHDAGLKPGHADALENTYCARLVAGTLDAMIPDAAIDPAAKHLQATVTGVRAHIGAAIVLRNGEIYGTLCAFRRTPDHTLRERDLKFLRFMAALIAERLETEHSGEIARAAILARLRVVMAAGDPRMVYQPIAALESGTIVGYEALARFHSEPRRTPDVWFAEARDAGVHEDLECSAITTALDAQALLGQRYLSINVSPALIASSRLEGLLAPVDCSRIVLEITEHDADPAPLRPRLDAIRRFGIRVALDDVGAGYSGLNRLLAIAPDVVKLDRALTKGVAHDTARQALVAAATAFTDSIGAALIAEGIESEEDLAALRGRGVKYGQGYFVGKPMTLVEDRSAATR